MANERNSYRLVRATNKDRERILTFLHANFFSNEPINASYKFPKTHTCFDNPLCLRLLPQGYSLLAVIGEDDAEEIIGVCMNGEYKSDDEVPDFSDRCERCTIVLTLTVKIEDLGDIWEKTKADCVLDVDVLSVRNDMRRLGLAQALVEKTQEMAIALDIPALVITCTSHYSAALAHKMGFKCLAEIKYDEYLDEYGVPVFEPAEPHKSVKAFVKMLK